MDIESSVDSSAGEEGLLGLAFHPNFQNNRKFYAYFSRNQPARTVLSQFTATSAQQANPNTEVVLLEISQPFSNHNGGQLQFGPDGLLYIAGNLSHNVIFLFNT